MGQYYALSFFRRSVLHFKSHTKQLFNPRQLNFVSFLYIVCPWYFSNWHSSVKKIMKGLYITQTIAASMDKLRKHLWIKWLAPIPCMCFWLAALWLNAVPRLSCQYWLTSLSPTGLRHSQVRLSVPLLGTSERWQAVGGPLPLECVGNLDYSPVQDTQMLKHRQSQVQCWR